MLFALIAALFILSLVCYVLGYIFLKHQSDHGFMARLTDNLDKILDAEGYKKQQGKHFFVLGTIFLLIPISLYFVNYFELNKKILFLWGIILIGAVWHNAFQVRKFYK